MSSVAERRLTSGARKRIVCGTSWVRIGWLALRQFGVVFSRAVHVDATVECRLVDDLGTEPLGVSCAGRSSGEHDLPGSDLAVEERAGHAGVVFCREPARLV